MLKDPYNRTVTNLRISLTSRCNLRCIYCHAEGEVNPKEQMSADEIAELMKVGAQFGIRSVKFTGGEPLLRQDLVDIIRSVPPDIESSLTTNGTLLASKAADLKEAGLARVNVSLDTLRPDRYRQITGKDCLNDALEGIYAAIHVGLTPVKINMVLLDGINEDELDDFMAFVRGKHDLVLQVIELMEFNECRFHGDVDSIEQELNERATRVVTRRMHHRKKYCLDGAEVEVVRPLHNTEFCAFCNRLRVTSDGNLKPCLLRTDNLVDIRGKHGKELEDAFREAVSRRRPYFT
ncbi:GTP 3',8-cyclase MoaA [Methanoculleus sp.]|uniref:GTP 3',8-cyclase MoaA n=1 Tax=Methanoculleus sp. TaxID=90427 RepID=UPI00261DD2DB|nr:GTP 3',8-cyclase MoaA [Methanoculleus sp.]MDI6866513.1 GTP 3',8-cyclase MoaA [Methanoculleus sp.]